MSGTCTRAHRSRTKWQPPAGVFKLDAGTSGVYTTVECYGCTAVVLFPILRQDRHHPALHPNALRPFRSRHNLAQYRHQLSRKHPPRQQRRPRREPLRRRLLPLGRPRRLQVQIQTRGHQLHHR